MCALKNTGIIIDVALFVFCLVGLVFTIEAQSITLSTANPPSITITQGTALTIIQGDCDGSGDNESLTVQPRVGGTAIASAIDLSSGSTIYTFTDVGEFALICDCTSLTSPTCSLAANVDVIPPSTIPTLGEWGLIILSLILACVSIAMMRSSVRSRTVVEKV